MFWRSMQCIFLVLCVSIRPHGASLQVPGENGGRTLKVGAPLGHPGYTINISAKGREGLVEVRDSSRTLVQTLTCPLLQGVPNPSALEMKGSAEQFVAHFATEDLNLDGYLDLKGPREFGAKWGRYCVWLFDPKSQTFSRGLFSPATGTALQSHG